MKYLFAAALLSASALAGASDATAPYNLYCQSTGLHRITPSSIQDMAIVPKPGGHATVYFYPRDLKVVVRSYSDHSVVSIVIGDRAEECVELD